MSNKNIIGQLSDEEFILKFPTASISHFSGIKKAITKFGRSTINYWMQHEDNSWTNYDCKTVSNYYL